MKNHARVRVHPLFAAVAMAVTLLCLVEIASVTGKLEQWTGDNATQLNARMSPLPPTTTTTTISRPSPDTGQSKVGTITTIDPSLQRQAILSALALDPLTASSQPGSRSIDSASSDATASGMTADGTTASGSGH